MKKFEETPDFGHSHGENFESFQEEQAPMQNTSKSSLTDIVKALALATGSLLTAKIAIYYGQAIADQRDILPSSLEYTGLTFASLAAATCLTYAFKYAIKAGKQINR